MGWRFAVCSTGRGRGGAMCVVWWWKVLESRGRGGDAPQGSRRPRGGCHRGLGHMHCDSAGPWQASAPPRLRKGCPGAMSSTRTTQIWRGASIGRAVCGTVCGAADAQIARECPRGVACLALPTSSPKASREYTEGLTDRHPPALCVAMHASYSGRLPQLPSRHAGSRSHEAVSSVHAVRCVAVPEVELL